MWPMVTALFNARVGALEKTATGKRADESPVGQGSGAGAAGSSVDISDALRDSMKAGLLAMSDQSAWPRRQ